MNEESIKQFELLLTSGKKVEAKELLKQIMAQPLSAEQQGALYSELSAVYLKVMNRLDQAYIQDLQSTIDNLKRLARLDQTLDDQGKLQQVRDDLAA